MPTIAIRIALWHEGIGVQFASDDVRDEFVDVIGGDRVMGQIEGRTLRLLAGGTKHQRIRTCDPDQHGGDRHKVVVAGNFAVDQIARFELHEVEMEASWPQVLVEIPPDHLLPWPKLRRCDLYYTPAEIVRQVLMRRRSAIDAGLDKMPQIPDSLYSKLQQSHLTEIFERSREYKRAA